MLYIIGLDDHERSVEVSYHVGTPYPGDFSRVTEIQADGDELEEIRKLFPAALRGTLVLKRVVIWTGVAAEMLYQIMWEKTQRTQEEGK